MVGHWSSRSVRLGAVRAETVRGGGADRAFCSGAYSAPEQGAQSRGLAGAHDVGQQRQAGLLDLVGHAGQGRVIVGRDRLTKLLVEYVQGHGSSRWGSDEERPTVIGHQRAGLLHQRPVAEDRKSTRLNSSHVKTSYAVFCLTKKQ